MTFRTSISISFMSRETCFPLFQKESRNANCQTAKSVLTYERHDEYKCNRSVMAGRARLSSARRAAIDGVRRRAEDRRALPPAVTEALRRQLTNYCDVPTPEKAGNEQRPN